MRRGRKCRVCGLPLSYPYQIHSREAVAARLTFPVINSANTVAAHPPECGHQTQRADCYGCIQTQGVFTGSEVSR